MNALIDAAFSRTRVVITALVVMILFGVQAYNTIPREAEPDIATPFVTVTIPLPGVSPEDAERLLVRPTELEVQSIEGLKEVNSLAHDGAATIILEFLTTIDIDTALIDVREAVDRAKSEYPTDAEEPVVEEFNTQTIFPIITVVISGDAPERALYRAAKRLQDRLEGADGVLEASLSGAREELMEVLVNPEVLESYGLTETEVINAVNSNNQLVTAGFIAQSDGDFNVKAPGLIKTADDLRSIPVRANGDSVVTLGDIAQARRTFVDRQGHAIFNGRPAIGVEITKRSGANIVETIERVRAITAQEAQYWPAAIQHSFIGDQSVFVKDNLEGLTASVMTAILLVMIMIVATLGFSSGIMVGLAIPISFLIGFLLLTLFDYTLNMMVMFGLVLSVGMLVDGAIVIIEFADRRMSEGADRKTAYMDASKRMFWPVVTSTATTLAAFFPFLFWESTVGEFMKFLPITLIFVLLSSLLVALIFLPVVGYLMRTPKALTKRFAFLKAQPQAQNRDIEDTDPRTLPGAVGIYARTLHGFIHRPILLVTCALVVVVICRQSFIMASPDVEFFIRADEEQSNIFILARGNLSADQKIDIAKEVAERVEDHPAIEHLFLQTNLPLTAGDDAPPPETIGQVGVDLLYYSDRDHSLIVNDEIRDLIEDVPGVFLEVRQRESGPPVGKDVQVEITGVNFEDMLIAARKLRNHVDTAITNVNGKDVPSFMDIEDTLPLPGIEWSMEIDREQAGRYGLSVAQAGAMMQFVTNGLLIDRYRPDDSEDEIDIRVRYPNEYRSVLGLDKINVQTPQGAVPLSNFVTRQARPQVDRITRRDGRRIIEVKANGNTRIPGHEISQDRAISEIRAYLESGALGDKVDWAILGADEETAEATAFFANALIAAMFTIAVILLLEFNNFYHAFLTLTAVVLSVFGVLLGIAISGQYVSVIMTGVGVVALAGIVVNNNIVLIDTYQHLRRKGLSVEDAVLRTAAQRVRPVLLTTTTTILGLLPMVFEINLDFAAGTVSRGSSTSDWWVLLSSAVVYGLAFSTVLTLILTPVLLAAPSIISRRFKFNDAGRKRLPPPQLGRSANPFAQKRHAAE